MTALDWHVRVRPPRTHYILLARPHHEERAGPAGQLDAVVTSSSARTHDLHYHPPGLADHRSGARRDPAPLAKKKPTVAREGQREGGTPSLFQSLRLRLAVGLGALRSRLQPGDVRAEAVFRERRAGSAWGGAWGGGGPGGAAAWPETLDYRPELPPIRNQGNKQSTCVAQVGACIQEWRRARATGQRERFSPQFLYNLRESPTEVGMTARNMLELLVQYGDCLEQTVPYGVLLDRGQMPPAAFQEARKYRVGSFAFVESVEGLKTALNLHGPCVMLVPCHNYGPRMWSREDGAEADTENQVGTADEIGHAFAVVGYTRSGFILRNSWGTSWGDLGGAFLGFGEWSSVWECWCVLG